jgi:hypothetical protein
MTMMIKITDDTAIAAALAAANGRAVTHTYTRAASIRDIALAAEARFEQLGIPKAQRAGASVVAISGDKLPSAYKYTPTRTRIVLTRRASAWYLTDVQAGELYHTPSVWMTLTPAQDDAAVAHLRRTAGSL